MLQNKVVVITGAGSGLGRAMAKAFAGAGATVVGLGRSEKNLADTGKEVEGAYRWLTADIGSEADVAAAFASVMDTEGRVDILFNNAAVYPKVNFLDESSEVFTAAVAANVIGIANCCKTALPHMVKQNFGRIFNLGSWAHLGPIEDSAVYSATKGCVHSLTKGIAVDVFAKHPDADIEIHEWIPGHLNTQMSDYTGMEPAVAAAWAVDIASRPHASKKNSIFEQNWEWQPPKSLKQRIKAKLMFWKK